MFTGTKSVAEAGESLKLASVFEVKLLCIPHCFWAAAEALPRYELKIKVVPDPSLRPTTLMAEVGRLVMSGFSALIFALFHVLIWPE